MQVLHSMTQEALTTVLYVLYYRVSTQRQAYSGLGIEAQKATNEKYFAWCRVNSINPVVIRIFYESERGRRPNRKKLKKAVRLCERENATLLVADMSRLSRDAFFGAALLSSKITIASAEKPLATKRDLLKDLIQADEEGETIQLRTKKAMAGAKRRGIKLGTYAEVMSVWNKVKAEIYAFSVILVINHLKAEGFKSEVKLAAELNKRKVKTYYIGCKWHPSTVHNLLTRIKTLEMSNRKWLMLSRFFSAFTDDEALTARLMAEHYDQILAESKNDQNLSFRELAQALVRARTIALKAIEGRPLKEKCWTDEKNFFGISSKQSELHREIFCLLYYRGFSNEQVSDKLRVPLEQVIRYRREVLQDIHDQTIHSPLSEE